MGQGKLEIWPRCGVGEIVHHGQMHRSGNRDLSLVRTTCICLVPKGVKTYGIWVVGGFIYDSSCSEIGVSARQSLFFVDFVSTSSVIFFSIIFGKQYGNGFFGCFLETYENNMKQYGNNMDKYEKNETSSLDSQTIKW